MQFMNKHPFGRSRSCRSLRTLHDARRARADQRRPWGIFFGHPWAPRCVTHLLAVFRTFLHRCGPLPTRCPCLFLHTRREGLTAGLDFIAADSGFVGLVILGTMRWALPCLRSFFYPWGWDRFHTAKVAPPIPCEGATALPFSYSSSSLASLYESWLSRFLMRLILREFVWPVPVSIIYLSLPVSLSLDSSFGSNPCGVQYCSELVSCGCSEGTWQGGRCVSRPRSTLTSRLTTSSRVSPKPRMQITDASTFGSTRGSCGTKGEGRVGRVSPPCVFSGADGGN